jgi:hypothetical protein
MAGYVEGVDRGQSTLFPDRLDDFVKPSATASWSLGWSGSSASSTGPTPS